MSTLSARTHAFKLKSCLLCFISIQQKKKKKLTKLPLVIAKFKYSTFDPLGGVKGGGVKIWH